MTELLVPQTTIALQSSVPEIVRSCLLTPPTSPGEDQTDADVWLPVPPGVNGDSLPPPPTIIDTSPDEMVGCIESTGDNPQVRLSALFPSPSEGDGVIERLNNDIWVYRTDEWVNVGPNPGPTAVIDNIIPFWNEKVAVIGLTRTFVSIKSLAYKLSLFTEIDITTKTNAIARIVSIVQTPLVLDVTIGAPLPSWTGLFPRIGAAVPASAVSINSDIPIIVLEERESDDYWSNWVAQNYGWESDIYPDAWAN